MRRGIPTVARSLPSLRIGRLVDCVIGGEDVVDLVVATAR